MTDRPVSLDVQIAVLREEANQAASYAKASAASRWPMPAAQARADALQAAVRTLEGVAVLQAHPIWSALPPPPPASPVPLPRFAAEDQR